MRKLFKKSIAFVLVFAMIASLAVTAGAAGVASTYPGADSYKTIPKRTYNGNPIAQGNPVITADGTRAIKTDTAAEYLFTAGDDELVYVDTDANGNMFVMMEKVNSGIGSEGFAYYDATKDNGEAPTGEEKYFNVNNSWSVASKLNSAEYKAAVIPVADEYLVDTNWYVETPEETPYYTTCKIALPSVVEIELYNQRIGSWKQAGILDANTLTRSAHFTSATAEPDGGITLNYASGNDRLQYGVQTTKGTVRPVFFIAKDYFKNVHLDVSLMGSDVKAYITATFTRDEMVNGTAGYTDEELLLIGFEEEEEEELYDTTYPGADAYTTIPKRTYNGNPIAQGNPVITADGTRAIKTDTAAEYLFTAGDDEMVFVDTDAYGNMFVMMEKVNSGIGSEGFALYDATKDNGEAPTGEEKYFNVNNSWSVASKLNSAEYKAAVIPVADEYLVDTNWYVETPEETPYYTTCKIALPSVVEIELYNQRIGSWKQSGILDANTLTRSAHFTSATAEPDGGITLNYASGNDRLQYGVQKTKCSVRPVFFINKNYFKNVHLDVSLMGSSIKEYIVSMFTKEEMQNGSAGYTEEELIAIGYEAATVTFAEEAQFDPDATDATGTLRFKAAVTEKNFTAQSYGFKFVNFASDDDGIANYPSYTGDVTGTKTQSFTGDINVNDVFYHDITNIPSKVGETAVTGVGFYAVPYVYGSDGQFYYGTPFTFEGAFDWNAGIITETK